MGFIMLVILGILVQMVVVPCTNVADGIIVLIGMIAKVSVNRATAGSGMPVSEKVMLPCITVLVYVIVVIRTNVADLVVILVRVSRYVDTVNLMSAGSCVPVVGLIHSPLLGIVGMLVVIVPCASVADTVVVNVGVCALSVLYRMVAGSCVPVVVRIVAPLLCKGMLMVIVPCASVTNAVVVGIGMLCLILNVNGMTAGNCEPVVGSIVRPLGSIGVSMTARVSTGIASAVVVSVSVCALSILHRVTAGCCVPVVGLVCTPLGCIGMLVVAGVLTYVTNTVIILVRVVGIVCLFVGTTAGSGVPVSFLVRRPGVSISMLTRLGYSRRGRR